MYYLLTERYQLRGWEKLPYALYDSRVHKPSFFSEEDFDFLCRLDALHDIDAGTLPPRHARILNAFVRRGIAREAFLGESLTPAQQYRLYPCRYKAEAHWSVTGRCNLRCRHCFMSAPGGKHGHPSYAQLLGILDQLQECGVGRVGITGGEPLIRSDFAKLLQELARRGMGLSCIYTNGMLVTGELLDTIEELGFKPTFQLSYDGVGCHDFLRGVPGSEEQTLKTLKLLQQRGFRISVSTCLHRKNLHTIRDTVNLMAAHGVTQMKISAIMELGEWAAEEVRGLSLTSQEELEAFDAYIPQFFADGAPLSLMLKGSFCYNKPDERWYLNYLRPCSTEDEVLSLSCSSIKRNFYIGADGMVAPCMGMGDCSYAEHFPNLYTTPLREILGTGLFMDLCGATVRQVRNGNDKCRSCPYIDRCNGGCRNTALVKGTNFYGPDPDVCSFFENGWDKRMSCTAAREYAAYCSRMGLEVKKSAATADFDIC